MFFSVFPKEDKVMLSAGNKWASSNTTREGERERERGGKEREGEGERERIDDPSPNHALIIYDWIRSSNRGMTKA